MSDDVLLLLTPAEAGQSVDPPLTPGGIRVAIRSGRLRIAALTKGGGRLLAPSEVERFQAERAARAAARRTRGVRAST